MKKTKKKKWRLLCTQCKDNIKRYKELWLEEMQKSKEGDNWSKFGRKISWGSPRQQEGKGIPGRQGHEPMSNHHLNRKQ